MCLPQLSTYPCCAMHSIGSIVVIESVDAVAPLCVRTEALVGELDVDAAGMSIVAYITSSIATSNLAGLIDERVQLRPNAEDTLMCTRCHGLIDNPEPETQDRGRAKRSRRR